MTERTEQGEKETPETAPAASEDKPEPRPSDRPGIDSTRVSASRGFGPWLKRMNCSLAFTSYQTGRLFLVGMLPDGRISLHRQNFVRAMGLHAEAQRLYVASLFQIWRLENVLAPTDRVNEHFDRLFVPRNAQTTGDVDAHELSIDKDGRVVFVNTKFSCLATMSVTHGFRPLWKPPFISRLAAEDRCHLNGLAMDGGQPAYATAVSRTDVVNGWRVRREEGGVLIDVRDDRIVTDKLSMPHSPRVAPDGIWLLDSGRGMMVRIDPESGKSEDIAFCPGFLRGLTLFNGHSIATISLPRRGAFDGLLLDDELKKRDAEPWCGLCIIDMRTGDLIEWLRLDGDIQELFDVAVIPGAACPMAVGIDSPDMQSLISFEKGWDEAKPA